MVSAYMDEGMSREHALSHLSFVDVNGLVVKSRKDLMEHNLPYAKDFKQVNFIEAIDLIKPHVLIGATGAPGTFTKEVIEHMSAHNERPVIFALSNPTSKAECTAEQAYAWSDGKAVFSSGSPFEKFTYKGKTFRTGQGNNAYVFPGIGLASVFCKAKTIPDEFFLEAARTLAQLVQEKEINEGALYPPIDEIRKCSLEIATNVCKKAYALKLARRKRPDNLKSALSKFMYTP
jgi:malate dehydrogenase (oxaloacetate-decarboxylating)(NADP+)